jgi:hypothetical protein
MFCGRQAAVTSGIDSLLPGLMCPIDVALSLQQLTELEQRVALHASRLMALVANRSPAPARRSCRCEIQCWRSSRPHSAKQTTTRRRS